MQKLVCETFVDDRFALNNHAHLGRPHLPEHLLLRDTLYLLQGISGKHVQFSPGSSSSNGEILFTDDPVGHIWSLMQRSLRLCHRDM